MARDHNKVANDARNHSASARHHSDKARRSSGEHLDQLGRMQKMANAAREDAADRSARRNRKKKLIQAAAKQT